MVRVCHADIAFVNSGSTGLWDIWARMASWISSVLTAEAKKAEGASVAALRNPRPPLLTAGMPEATDCLSSPRSEY